MKYLIAFALIASAFNANAMDAVTRKDQLTAQIKALQAEKKAITKQARIEKAIERVKKAQDALEKARSN